jgi:hypothetical protein
MASILSLTFGANGPPLSVRHACVTAAFGFRADAAADFPPNWSVSLLQTGQCMRNFMQDTIAHRIGVVREHKIDGQLDPPLFMATQTHRPLRTIERKRPTGQTVKSHQIKSQFSRVGWCECAGALHDKLRCSIGCAV